MNENLSDHQTALISEFCGITGVPPSEARRVLNSSLWNLDAAVTMWYASQDEGEGDMEDEDDAAPEDFQPAPAPTAAPSGGRTLGGDPAPAQASSSSSQPPQTARRQPPARGLRTLQDLQSQGGGRGHGHGSDDDSEEGQDFFAGGEKSGLAVQNPGSHDHINSILERARRNVPRPPGDEPEAPRSRFIGTAHTLGGDDTPSQTIHDPRASRPPPAPRVRRTLHLWEDGFSIDDGDLYRYDDPENAHTLALINSGRAPIKLLNVEDNQEVDLEVAPHKSEKFVPPKKKYKPFSGSGQRLGSPAPGASSSSSSSVQPAVSAPSAAGSASSAPPQVSVDDAQPTLTLQIRLGDGTSLRSRFNTTHTIGDVYAFVDAASPASRQRPYALMTTFPSKELDDRSAVLGEMAEFKRGGVVVQKWV